MSSTVYTMRALANPGPGYVTWQYGYPDYLGTYAPAPIMVGTAVIVSGPVPLNELGKLGLDYGPAGLWLFNNNLNDSSGNGFNLAGATPYTTLSKDKILGAIYQTPLGGFSRPARDAALAIIGAVTIEAVMVVTMPTAGMAVCSIGNSGETEADNVAFYAIIGAPNGEMSLFWESGAGVNRSIVSAAGVVPVGTPCHLVWTRSADAVAQVNMYANGVNIGNGAATAATGCTAATCLFRIGLSGSGTDTLGRGNILLCLKVIAAELTPAQVVAEYNRVLGGRGITYPIL